MKHNYNRPYTNQFDAADEYYNKRYSRRNKQSFDRSPSFLSPETQAAPKPLSTGIFGTSFKSSAPESPKPQFTGTFGGFGSAFKDTTSDQTKVEQPSSFVGLKEAASPIHTIKVKDGFGFFPNHINASQTREQFLQEENRKLQEELISIKKLFLKEKEKFVDRIDQKNNIIYDLRDKLYDRSTDKSTENRY
jgi:hypothetical protein